MAKSRDFKIKEIAANETYTVRHPVLRTGKPVETCVFNGDDLPSTIHIGLYNGDTIVGVVSFMKNNNILFSEISQYQLRGMAVLKEFQGNGLGRMLIDYGENLLRKNQIGFVWCNAREVALNFYRRAGYSIIGSPFEIPEIGVHYVMFKKI